MSTPIFLIPGFWLNAESWDDVAAALSARGFDVRGVTLPGMESLESDRRGITLADHVNFVVGLVDEAGEPSVLVGHSAGGAISHAVADARPDKVRAVIYVDSMPLGDGECVNAELPVVDGEIPLPEWSVFGEEDLIDLSGEIRESFRRRAVPVPAAVASDPQRLSDPRRYDVPSLVIACEYPSADIKELMEKGHPWAAEAAALRQLDFVDLPTGHWPQFTRPHDLAEVLAAALAQWVA